MCRRGSFKATSRSHSNRPTIRRQYVNIQSRWMNGKQVAICASCIKTQKKKASKNMVAVKAKKQ